MVSKWELRLLGCWQLFRDGSPVTLGIRQQRLIAVLALSGPCARPYIGGLLWPESSQSQAAGSVRAAVFKLRHELPGLLAEGADPVSLCEGVRVDALELRRSVDPESVGAVLAPGIEDRLAGHELLPGWYDDWVIFQQERWQGFRMAALEAIARHRLEAGHAGSAITAAERAAEIEPLRESPQALLIRAQILAGDAAAAVRSHERFRNLLWEEMGLKPSAQFREALGAHLAPRHAELSSASAEIRQPVGVR
ncbi:AfsR/SARP family transcriptional regulator [Sinomonas susongensis]|uniref:AfsR/SARP family transcriptional regulator n=1 Tax=Sinomonas susongensis TaxID=1324851 RepID=UPI0011098CF5|nr:BTAD domain-containing putative transcriptional regulator [Sinomonas susongensis]